MRLNHGMIYHGWTIQRRDEPRRSWIATREIQGKPHMLIQKTAVKLAETIERFNSTTLEETVKLREQNAALLAALEDMLAMYGPRGGEIVWDGPCEQARAAIAAAKVQP